MAVKAAEAEKEKKTENSMREAERAAESGTERVTAAEETKTVVYIGPSLPSGMLKQNRVMIGTDAEIRKELAEAIGKFPLIEKLIVPVAELAEAKNRARTGGNVLNKYCADLNACIAAYDAKRFMEAEREG